LAGWSQYSNHPRSKCSRSKIPTLCALARPEAVACCYRKARSSPKWCSNPPPERRRPHRQMDGEPRDQYFPEAGAAGDRTFQDLNWEEIEGFWLKRRIAEWHERIFVGKLKLGPRLFRRPALRAWANEGSGRARSLRRPAACVRVRSSIVVRYWTRGRENYQVQHKEASEESRRVGALPRLV